MPSSWRAKAVATIQQDREGGLHYSSVFTMSEKDFEELKETMIQNIVRSRKLIGPSLGEEAYCLNLDLFVV